LVLQKQQEIQIFIDRGIPMAPNWTNTQIETKAREILRSEPLLSLLKPDSPGVLYPYYARSSRKDIECTRFLTERGGSYFSKTKQEWVIQKKSKPILRKRNQQIIKPSELWEAGFQTATLFEQRNWVNVAAVEKRLQTIVAVEVCISRTC
jgi:hypothetical protein